MSETDEVSEEILNAANAAFSNLIQVQLLIQEAAN